MKTTFAALAIAVLTRVATPIQLAAQQPKGTQPKHHAHKLIDIGTFGGLNGGVHTHGNGGFRQP